MLKHKLLIQRSIQMIQSFLETKLLFREAN